MVMDGRILNPMLVAEGPADDIWSQTIPALAYQSETGHVYAATHQGTQGLVQKYDLVGEPQALEVLDEEIIHWQEDVALSTDGRGHLFILVDAPPLIIELDDQDQIVNVYGFRDRAGDSSYPAVTHWLPGSIGQPQALAVSPDGSMLFIVDKNQDRVNLTAFSVK
jgi:6-phosphogluconolactonase (cycloisomerase 2 family)